MFDWIRHLLGTSPTILLKREVSGVNKGIRRMHRKLKRTEIALEVALANKQRALNRLQQLQDYIHVSEIHGNRVVGAYVFALEEAKRQNLDPQVLAFIEGETARKLQENEDVAQIEVVN